MNFAVEEMPCLGIGPTLSIVALTPSGEERLLRRSSTSRSVSGIFQALAMPAGGMKAMPPLCPGSIRSCSPSRSFRLHFEVDYPYLLVYVEPPVDRLVDGPVFRDGPVALQVGITRRQVPEPLLPEPGNPDPSEPASGPEGGLGPMNRAYPDAGLRPRSPGLPLDPGEDRLNVIGLEKDHDALTSRIRSNTHWITGTAIAFPS